MTAMPKYESTSTSISLPLPVPAQGEGGEGEEEENEGIIDEPQESVKALSDISDEELESAYEKSLAVKQEEEEDSKPVVSPHPLSELSSFSDSLIKNGMEADLSEELLYLRLMALRSMVPSSGVSSESNKSPSSKSLEEEMNELLDEADKAAAASQSSIPPPPVIDIADSDEEKMDLYMKTMTTNMSFLAPIATKVKKEEDEEEPPQPQTEGSEGQNLAQYLMKLQHSLDNEDSKEDGPFYSPTQSPVQISPPLSPEVIPLPPGSARQPNNWSLSSKSAFHPPHQPVDMELGSENEAEIQFFKHQKEEVPCDGRTSWNGNAGGLPTSSTLLQHPPPSIGVPPQMLYNCDHYLYQERMYQERILPPPRGEKERRTNVVVSVPKSKKRMRKRKSASVRILNSSDDDEEDRIRQSMKKRVTPPPPTDPLDSEDEEAMRAHLLSTIAAKRKSAPNKELPTEDKSRSKQALPRRSSKPLLSKLPKKSNETLLLTEMPFEKLKKYFPNMVRPFIIPLNIPTSSEEESTSVNSFQANLDLLMKNAREGSFTERPKRVPPPKPARKNPPRSKGGPTNTALLLNSKTHPIRKRHVSLVEKESLKTRSSIEHLPIERQKEYKMLLARIAMKEKKQREMEVEPRKETKTDDPEEMRRLLLSKMKNLKSKIDQNKIDLKKKVYSESKENSEPLLKKTPEKVEEESELEERILASEKEVISSRNDVVNGLFKLSAQLSQFHSESEKLITAQNFLSDLLKQVEETRKLIMKKEERITQLRNVVKLSHLAMSKKRRDLAEKEVRCKDLGFQLSGDSYQLPETGTDQIKRKLVQIASSAKLCKKVNRDSVGKASTPLPAEEESPSEAKEISGVSSSIAHLRGQSGGNEIHIDPHREFCRFELLGKCNDDACPYQHHKTVS